MPDYRRVWQQGGTYFFTVEGEGRILQTGKLVVL